MNNEFSVTNYELVLHPSGSYKDTLARANPSYQGLSGSVPTHTAPNAMSGSRPGLSAVSYDQYSDAAAAAALLLLSTPPQCVDAASADLSVPPSKGIGCRPRRLLASAHPAFGELDATATCFIDSLINGGTPVTGGWAVAWTDVGRTVDGFSLSRQSAQHRVTPGLDGCSLRYASKHVSSGGVLSLWKQVRGSVNYVFYKDGAAVYELILRHKPHLSHSEANKLVKIRNGNTAMSWVGDPAWPVDGPRQLYTSFIIEPRTPGNNLTVTSFFDEVHLEVSWYDPNSPDAWCEPEVAIQPGCELIVEAGVVYAAYEYDAQGAVRAPFGPRPDCRLDRPLGPELQLQYVTLPLGPAVSRATGPMAQMLLLISGIEPNPGPVVELFNYYDPLVVRCEAAAAAFVGDPDGSLQMSDVLGDYEAPEFEEFPVEPLFDDLACVASINLVAPVVKALAEFDAKPEKGRADVFNTWHRLMDSCGDKESELPQGPRRRTRFDSDGTGPAAAAGAKGKTGGKSPAKGQAQKIRDNVRRRQWMESLNPSVAEAWVRANKPDPSQVARGTDYLEAYARRTRRGEFYTRGVEDPAAFMLFDFLDSEANSPRGCCYVGPMSRRLIQGLLVIGNVEVNPGPVPGLDSNNFGYTGKSHADALSAGLNFLLSSQINQFDVVGWPLDVASLDALAQPCAVAGSDSVGYNCPADWVISHSYPNAVGIQFNQPYRRVWRGEWAVETCDDFGAVVDFPDDASFHAMRLVGKVHLRDAAGVIDPVGPVLQIYRNVPNVLNRGVRSRSGLVRVGGGGSPGIQIAYFRGCNTVAVNHGQTTFEVPTAAWAECEKFFASGIKRQVATSNASQVLRNASVPGEHFGIILLALSEAMLPSAAVSTAVSTHREAAIERARRGQSLRYGWVESVLGRGPVNPDYHGMLVSCPEPPWQAVWSIRALIFGVIAILSFGAGSQVLAMMYQLVLQCIAFVASMLNAADARRRALYEAHKWNPFVMFGVCTRAIRARWQLVFGWGGLAREIVPLGWGDWFYGGYRVVFPSHPFAASLLPGVFMSNYVAPVLEEILRRLHPAVTLVLIVCETARMMWRGQGFVSSFVDRVTIHGFLHCLPIELAVPFHMAHNIVINCSDGRFEALGWGVVQKGVKWYASDPMGLRSTYDAYYNAVKPPIDPLMNLVIRPPRLYQAPSPSGRVFSLFPPILDMTSYKPNRGNFVQSAVGRVGRVTPQITDHKLLAEVREAVGVLADACRSRFGLVEPVPFEDFVSKFPPAKAQAYRDAAELFDAVGTRPIFDRVLYRDFRADECAAFIKHELNADVPDMTMLVNGVRFESAATDCRTILPRWLPLQSQMIPYILAMERNVKEILADLGPALFGKNLRFASGLNNRELGEMARELMLENGLDSIIVNGDDAMFTVKGVAYYVDGKRWDAHFRSEHHYCIIDAYSRMGLPSHLVEALTYLVNRKIRWGSGVSATIERNNASGESDTTFRNGIQNVITLLVALREEGFVARAVSLGFVYEVCAVQVDVRGPAGDFCARTWIHTESGGELILKVGRVTSKMCSTAGSSVPFQELRVAKVEAAIRDLSAFPEVCTALARLTRGAASTKRAVEWVKAQKYDRTESSNVVTSFEQRQAYFAGRYAVDYGEYVGELNMWCSDVLTGGWPEPGPIVRLVAEIDMAVSPVSDLPGTKGIRLQGTLHLGGARARVIEDSPGRSGWLALSWNAFMKMVNGNGSVRSINGLVVSLALVMLLMQSAGGREWQEFIPEQTLSYQRYQQYYQIRMPTNKRQTLNQPAHRKEGKDLSKAVAQLRLAEKQHSKESSRLGEKSRGQKQRANVKFEKAGSKIGAVLSKRAWTNLSYETALWRKSIVDPFTFQGVHTCGEFYTRGVVPYTIKRSIQLGSTSANGAHFVFNPSLNNMCWNTDGTAFSFQGSDTWCMNTTAPSNLNALPLPPVSTGGGLAVGVSLPGLATSFEKFRIVSWGVKLRCDASFLNTGGRIAIATYPYEGYLPYVSTSTGGAGTVSMLPSLDNSIQNGTLFLSNTATIYASHPNSIVADRPLTAASIMNDMGFGATASGQFQSLLNIPGAKVYTVNDIAGKEIMINSLPCSPNVFTWRDTGNSATLANPGTTNEVIYLNAGSDDFPGAIQTSTAVAPTVNGIIVSTAVDASALKSLGFETISVFLSGINTSTAIIDAELIYNIEALPNTKAAVNFAGIIPSSTTAAKNGVPKAEAEAMLRDVSTTDPITIREVLSVGGPLVAAAAGPTGGLFAAGISALSAAASAAY